MNEKTILKIFVGVCFVVLVVIGGLLVTALTQDDVDVVVEPIGTTQLSEQEAISIASALDLGTYMETELEDEDGTLVYAVEFVSGDTEYEVLVDAMTGVVFEIEEETIISIGDIEASITEAQAKATALAAVDGTVTEVEIEKEDGSYVYAVEILTAAGEEVDVLVDVQTGEVVEIETEADDEEDDDEEEEELTSEEIDDLDADVTQDEAEEIALAAVGGGEVTEVEVEKDGGKYVYEVEVQYDGNEYDVIIDLETGEVLEIEKD